jgi:hypothetical protein
VAMELDVLLGHRRDSLSRRSRARADIGATEDAASRRFAAARRPDGPPGQVPTRRAA